MKHSRHIFSNHAIESEPRRIDLKIVNASRYSQSLLIYYHLKHFSGVSSPGFLISDPIRYRTRQRALS